MTEKNEMLALADAIAERNSAIISSLMVNPQRRDLVVSALRAAASAEPMPQNVEIAIKRMRCLADSALGSLYEVECQREMRNACILLEAAYGDANE